MSTDDGLAWSTLEVEGVPVLRYVAGARDGRPLADLAEPIPSDDEAPGMPLRTVAALAVAALPGWLVASSDRGLVTALTAERALPLRHRFVMSAPTAPHADAPLGLPPGIHLIPLSSTTPLDLLPSWQAAYPVGHVDHEPGTVEEILASSWDHVADPAWQATEHRSSAIAVLGETIVGGIIVDIRSEPVPFGGPWLSDIWRLPGHSQRGLGAWLISRALRLLHEDGLATLGLSVTHGNPARRLYERLGFTEMLESWTLRIPDA